MPMTFKLVRGATELELNAGPVAGSGWRISRWRPNSILPIYGREAAPVQERIELMCDTTSHDEMARLFQALDEMRIWAEQYLRDPATEHPVWLQAQMEHESKVRQTLVRSAALRWLSPQISTHSGPESNRVRVRLDLIRAPWWESESDVDDTANAGNLSGASIVVDYDAVDGDLPARLSAGLLIFSNNAGADVGRFWMGFRSDNHASLSNFEPIWELEDGTNNASESGITDDAATDVNNSSPGSGSGVFVKLIETDLDWDKSTNGGIFQKICSINLSDVSADEQAQFGDYLWLLRAKLSASSTWEVQLRFGAADMGDDDFIRKRIIEVDSTSWDYKEMGRGRVPVRDLHTFPVGVISVDYDASFEIQVWGRRTSGSANLYLDCVCPIPVDEGWLKSWQFALTGTGSTHYWHYGEGPDRRDQALAYSADTGMILSVAAFQADNLRVPPGDGRLIIVYADETSSDITDPVYAAELHYFPRWANLRGSE